MPNDPGLPCPRCRESRLDRIDYDPATQTYVCDSCACLYGPGHPNWDYWVPRAIRGLQISTGTSEADGTPCVWIDTEGLPEDGAGPLLRIYLNDEVVYENPAYPTQTEPDDAPV